MGAWVGGAVGASRDFRGLAGAATALRQAWDQHETWCMAAQDGVIGFNMFTWILDNISSAFRAAPAARRPQCRPSGRPSKPPPRGLAREVPDEWRFDAAMDAQLRSIREADATDPSTVGAAVLAATEVLRTHGLERAQALVDCPIDDLLERRVIGTGVPEILFRRHVLIHAFGELGASGSVQDARARERLEAWTSKVQSLHDARESPGHGGPGIANLENSCRNLAVDVCNILSAILRRDARRVRHAAAELDAALVHADASPAGPTEAQLECPAEAPPVPTVEAQPERPAEEQAAPFAAVSEPEPGAGAFEVPDSAILAEDRVSEDCVAAAGAGSDGGRSARWRVPALLGAASLALAGLVGLALQFAPALTAGKGSPDAVSSAPMIGRYEMACAFDAARWRSVEALRRIDAPLTEAALRMGRPPALLLTREGGEWERDDWEGELYPRYGCDRADWPKGLEPVRDALDAKFPKLSNGSDVRIDLAVWHLLGGGHGVLGVVSRRTAGQESWKETMFVTGTLPDGAVPLHGPFAARSGSNG